MCPDHQMSQIVLIRLDLYSVGGSVHVGRRVWIEESIGA